MWILFSLILYYFLVSLKEVFKVTWFKPAMTDSSKWKKKTQIKTKLKKNHTGASEMISSQFSCK